MNKLGKKARAGKNLTKTAPGRAFFIKQSIFGRFWGPIGDPFGAIKGEIRGLKSDLCSSRVPGGVQGSILGGFLMILGAML